MARTINSPGVEIFERDESETAVVQAGTTILVMGFAHQGPTNELIHISSKEELNQVYFGGNGPTNDAEEYFYLSCAEILNSPANLMTIRLPYGLDSGDGFSGKYVALAYGGTVDVRAKTKYVNVQTLKDYFIPAPTASNMEASAVLNEFTSATVKKNDPETGVFYTALDNYVASHPQATGYVKGQDNPFEWAELFHLNDEHFWVDVDPKGESIDTFPPSEKTVKCYDFDVCSASGDFIASANIQTKTIAATSTQPSGYEAITGWTTSSATFTMKFKDVGYVTPDFRDNVLNTTLWLYDEDLGHETESDVHPLRSSKFIYARANDGENITYYRINLDNIQWSNLVTTTFADATASIAAATDENTVVSTYIKIDDKTRVYAGKDKNEKQTVCVDTEKIGDTIVTKIIDKITTTGSLSSGLTVEFENGIPMQDVASKKDSYIGKFAVEAITPVKKGRLYQLNNYNNVFEKDAVREMELEVPDLDEDGNEIFQNVLTINPEPLAIPLSEYQYQAIQEGAIEWKNPEYFLDGIATGYDAFRTILGKSAFYVINKMQTTIDDKYQGFYLALMDYKKFEERKYGDINKSYDAIKKIKYVDQLGDTMGNLEVTTLPDRTCNFDVAGPESLSTNIMSKVVGIFAGKRGEDRDNLVVATVRCGRRASSSDPSKLSYDIKDVTFGSFNPESTTVDPITKGRIPNIIDTKMKSNDYVEFVSNEKFKYEKHTPKIVQFGGYDNATSEAEAGSCCSLGVAVPCVEDDTTEYIGSVPNKIEKALSLCDNIYELDLDIVIDAGLSTIWAYVAEDTKTAPGTYTGAAEFVASKYIENNTGTNYDLLTRAGDEYTASDYYLTFDTIRALFNNFCEKTRKDCMYLLDPLRCVFVRGLDSKLMNINGKIFSIDVARPLRNLFSNANSSYGASYANWVKVYDSFNDKFVWMPSSPYEAAIMARVDATYYPWYAPYGLNNGILSSITDIALRTSPKQQDDLYKMGLNMFVFFNGDGYVSWGQKTLQTKVSAFDRINVRRLFLYLERSTFKTIRYFVAEPNTTFTRARVVSALTPIFDTAKANEGCYDYAVYCNEVNNTAAVIDANELAVDIYVKPTRIIDFIEVTFHATRTDASFEELFNG